ncbi:BRICHOS domain [Trinorchestia longiramus]|nr:BRICHOS domain [Trinorchestia longiramus]
MYLRALVFLPLLSLVAARSEDKFTINYQAGDELSNTTISFNEGDRTIETYTPAGEHFVEVESIEDFDVGFSATRLPSEEVCYIAKLEKTFPQQLAYYRSHEDTPITITASKQLSAIPVIDDEEFGDRLNDFCSDYPMYKLGFNGDEDSEEGPSARRVFVKFYYCYPTGCRPYCYQTVVAVPTGRVPAFTWFCG